MEIRNYSSFFVLCLLCLSNVADSQPPDSTKTVEEKVYRGQVIDTEGNPIADATVLFNDYGQEINSETPKDHIKQTDDDGQFELRVQVSGRTDRGFQQQYVWAYKLGYDIRCVTPIPSRIDNLELVLGKSTSVEFQFNHPDGVPFESTRAAPYAFALPNGRYTADKDTGLSGPLPKTIRRLLSQPVAKDGAAEITGVPKPLLESVEVSSATIGRQIMSPTGQPGLVACGSLSCKIECPPEQLPAEVQVYVTVSVQGQTIGNYIATTNKDGSFSLSIIPAGRADIQFSWPETSSVIPVPPRPVDLAANRENMVNVPVVPVVNLRGRVILSDTGEPVREGRLSLRSKNHPNVGRVARTDKDGWYESKMPSGDITVQLFTMRHSSTHQYPPIASTVIPKDVKQFQLKPMEVDPKNVVRGFIIDERGKKIAGRHIVVYSPKFGHLQGIAKTDKDGRFRLPLNNWDADRLTEALRKKQNQDKSRLNRWELKVLPPIKIDAQSLNDQIAAIKKFPEIKVRSFSPVVVQITSD